MSIPGAANPLLLATAAAGGYQISRSLRFNSSDSAYLSRTPASAGNRKTWTWAGWVKRSALDSDVRLFEAGTSSTDVTWFGFVGANSFRFEDYSGGSYKIQLSSSALYRDVSAWYHIVIAVDTTQATSSNRVALYINGVQITSLGISTYPSQNFDTRANNTVLHTLGGSAVIGGAAYFNGCLADIHFIDGQALTPSSFTEVSATTGQLLPRQYTGSFGTNGFWLKFSDNSAATATTLGKDYSGNSNNWTPSNLSVTAGAGNDSIVDTPTSYGTDTGAGGSVRGNYCTLNPLSNTAGALSNGNLDVAGTASVNVRTESTVAVSSGKWYFEVTPTALAGTFASLGIGTVGALNKFPGEDASSYSWYPQYVNKQNNTVATSYGSAVSVNGVVMVAFDLDNNKIYFGGNGTWFGSSNPATGSNPAYTINAGTYTPIFRAYDTGSAFAVNFGQRPFAYTAPSGFKALCDTNLPAPVVAKPSTVMDVKLYTGNGSTQTISGLGFSPDFVWIKTRSVGYYHVLYDIVRGTGTGKALYSNTTDAEGADSTLQNLTTFNSDGFSLGTTSGTNIINDSSQTRVAWCWDAGSTTVTNTQGSITSSVRANASAGFSIVSYTSVGTSTSLDTIGHGLNISPSIAFIKNRDLSDDWWVYSSLFSDPTKDYLVLNSTSAKGTFGSTSFSASSTTIGIRQGLVASSAGQKIIVYAFAPVAGYSSFGSFTGSSDLPFIHTGFKPRWLLLKNAGASGDDWALLDSARNTYNELNSKLWPNTSAAEATLSGNNSVDFLANGFKMRSTNNATNSVGNTMVYACFAESPFAYSRAR